MRCLPKNVILVFQLQVKLELHHIKFPINSMWIETCRISRNFPYRRWRPYLKNNGVFSEPIDPPRIFYALFLTQKRHCFCEKIRDHRIRSAGKMFWKSLEINGSVPLKFVSTTKTEISWYLINRQCTKKTYILYQYNINIKVLKEKNRQLD